MSHALSAGYVAVMLFALMGSAYATQEAEQSKNSERIAPVVLHTHVRALPLASSPPERSNETMLSILAGLGVMSAIVVRRRLS